MAIDLAPRRCAEIVIGTDPDADRMGVAVRDADGKMQFCSPATRSAR
jgi:phosphoglucomutase